MRNYESSVWRCSRRKKLSHPLWQCSWQNLRSPKVCRCDHRGQKAGEVFISDYLASLAQWGDECGWRSGKSARSRTRAVKREGKILYPQQQPQEFPSERTLQFWDNGFSTDLSAFSAVSRMVGNLTELYGKNARGPTRSCKHQHATNSMVPGSSCWQTNKCDDDDDDGGGGGGGTPLVNPQSLTSEDDLCCHRKRRACQLRGRGQQEALRGAGSLKGNGQQNLFSHKIDGDEKLATFGFRRTLGEKLFELK